MLALNCFGSSRDRRLLQFLAKQAVELSLTEDLPGFTHSESWDAAAFGIVLERALKDPEFATDRLFIVRFVYAAIRNLHDSCYGAVTPPGYDEVVDFAIGFALGRRTIQSLKLDDSDKTLAKKIARYLRDTPVNGVGADFK